MINNICPPTNVSSVWPNVPGAQNLSWPPQLNRSQHATGQKDIHFKTQPRPVAKNATPRPPAGN